MSRSINLQSVFLNQDWCFEKRPQKILNQKFTTVLRDDDLSDSEACFRKGFRVRPLKPATVKASGASEVKTENGFQVSLDVEEFEREELSVKTYDRFVEVKGEHGEKRDRHGLVSKKFCRRYRVPDDCDINALKSYFSPDHKLTLKAPLSEVQKELNIPMEVPVVERKLSPLVMEVSSDECAMKVNEYLGNTYNNRLEADGEDLPASHLGQLLENKMRDFLNQFRVTEEEAEPEGESEDDTVTDKEGETATDKKAEPEGETVTDEKADTEGETVTEKKSDPEGDTATDKKTERVGEMVADKKSEPEGDAATDKKSEGETVPDKKAEPEGETVPDKKAEPEGETVPDKKAEPEGETVPDKKSEPEGETATDKKAEPKGDTEGETAESEGKTFVITNQPN